MSDAPSSNSSSVILVRYGEIALKGKNRVNFERKLIENIRNSSDKIRDIKKTSGRIILYPSSEKYTSELIGSLKKVFGIVSVSTGKEIEIDLDAIKEEAFEQSKKIDYDNFRVTVQRTQKRLKPSPELEREIGAFIVEKTCKKVRLKEPELEIFVDIADKAYIFTKKVKCLGGLPIGIEGNVGLLVENNNSILAGFLMMKRGCYVHPFMLDAKDEKIAGKLETYGSRKAILAISIDELDRLLERNRCKALVTGTTLKGLEGINDKGINLISGLTILMPLVGFSDDEISDMLKDYSLA